MRRADGHISAIGWVFVLVCTILTAVFAVLALLVVLVIRSNDQSEQNQRHIDCIVALSQPVIPERCEPVKAQLIADGIIPPGFDRSTTTTAAP